MWLIKKYLKKNYKIIWSYDEESNKWSKLKIYK